MSHSNVLQDTYWKKLISEVAEVETLFLQGEVFAVEGALIKARNLSTEIGSECIVGNNSVPCEVISVSDQETILISYKSHETIRVGDVVLDKGQIKVQVGKNMLGRVLNGMGTPIDGLPPILYDAKKPLRNEVPPVMECPLITEQLFTNIKVIDAFMPFGKGQRVGIFAGSGIGKSTLLGMMTRHSRSDINVVVLVGERGREVKEMVEYDIGEEGLKNTVVIAAISDESAAMRLRAVFYGCAVAEYFRDLGNDVCFMVDSFTRIAHAQREIGMMRGELPIARGYPTSLYHIFPQIVERCGTSDKGTITGIFTVLVEGDDDDEPVTDIVRGIVDGHVILSRELAHQMQYPAVYISGSLSRVANKVQDKKMYDGISKIRERLGLYEQAKDIINAGVYTPGGNRKLDQFMGYKESLDDFLKQDVDEGSNQEEVENFIYRFAERLT